MVNTSWFDSLEAYQSRKSLYLEILSAFTKLQGKSLPFVLRALLRYFFEQHSHHISSLLTFTFSSHLYRIFASLTSYDFSLASLQSLFGLQNPNSSIILLFMFEVSLFNKLAIKEVKSTSLIYQREKIFEYFAFKEKEIVMNMT